MVTREHPEDPGELMGIRDAFAQLNMRIDDVNARIDDLHNGVNARIDDLRKDMNARVGDLRDEMNARFRLLMWGTGIGFAAVIAILGALLARGG